MSDRALRAHVLVVEDEPVTRELVVECLRRAGHEVTAVGDGAQARAAFARESIDLVMLDVELPGEDGFSLASVFRARPQTAIIFLTRRADVVDRVVGLELGGDDYVIKPPDLHELVARVRAVLRRRLDASAVFVARAPTFGGWRFEPERRSLLAPRGERVGLTLGEVTILRTLLDADGRVVERSAMLGMLGAEGIIGGERSLEVLVHRLRKKLGEGGSVVPRLLVTVHGVGYRIVMDEPPRTSARG